ncbi:uncharacterized protein LOC129765625 [Toxorhynchites rutilus septentrionalis]|uniref:uncharacterized protein LOC129765625 n=1 Tax=Toxorhynchites rutilus septentrionalis TaxID=329112 RepID=UPI00247A8994|nr:uncharacterized protein LOC129765625 [Toxorhynchites rutilus septentrionalis]
MAFNQLSLDALVYLFKQLEPQDRLRCSEVCRSWNEAFSTVAVLRRDFILKIHSHNAGDIRNMLEHSSRRYRQFKADLRVESGDGVIECLAEVAHQEDIQYLWLIGEPEPIQRGMQSISFGSVVELKLEFLKEKRRWMQLTTEEIVLENLKRFHCIQLQGMNTANETAIHLVAPNLEEAIIVLKGQEKFYKCEFPLVELEACSKLRHLEIDLKGLTWETFFGLERPLLERLVIRQIVDNDHRDWNTLFANMPNLRSLEISGPHDYRDCFRACYFYDDGVNIGGLKAHALERMHIRNIHIRGTGTLQCASLKELTLTDVMVENGNLTLVAPVLARLTMRQCTYSLLRVHTGNLLEFIEMDCFENQCQEIKTFFDSLENLRELKLYIDREAKIIVYEFGNLPSLERLELQFYVDSNLDDFAALSRAIGINCPVIEKFVFQKKQFCPFNLKYTVFAQMYRMRKWQPLEINR